MNNVNEETRSICPHCKSGTVGPGESECAACKKKQQNESCAGGVAGFQLPIGIKNRKEKLDTVMKNHPDINEGQMLVFLRGLDVDGSSAVCEALDAGKFDQVADQVRESVVRQVIRRKISEVVRKKAGGGGYVLYAPNKGKKHPSRPVGQFPTKLAAKRAELARFPPKDPKKLRRLRREIERLMKDPKKRAEAEKRAMKAKGMELAPKAPKARKTESLILSKIVVNEVRNRMLNEGLFKEDAAGSEWDEYIKKISDRALQGDKGFSRVMAKFDKELTATLGKALKVVQKQLGGTARVKPLGTKMHDDGRKYVAFQINSEASEVGPIYVYADNGVPRIELSDQAKSAVTKTDPELARGIRAALAGAQDALEGMDSLRALIGQRDAYLSKTEGDVDSMIANMSPLQVSMLKRLLVKKYRGAK